MPNTASLCTPCPHPDCDGTIGVPPDLPAGVYLCKCQACHVRLGWAAYLHGTRRPYLALVSPPTQESSHATQ